MKFFNGQDKANKLVRNDTVKPSPTEYPPLLPTLQTYVGMVTMNGKPQWRSKVTRLPDKWSLSEIQERAEELRSIWSGYTIFQWLELDPEVRSQIEENFKACAQPVTKDELIGYISSGKRIDTEQAVAMIISFFASQNGANESQLGGSDGFEHKDQSILQELVNDPGVASMLKESYMWRVGSDFDNPPDPQDFSKSEKRRKVFSILKRDSSEDYMDDFHFISVLQQIRRRRAKLEHTQHLAFSDEFQLADNPEEWGLKNNYRYGRQDAIDGHDLEVVPKAQFRCVQRILSSMAGRNDPASVYIQSVRDLIKDTGFMSLARLSALRESTDAAAVAYSFIAAQRKFQLKVVSDYHWSRFLIKGEGAFVLQNRPDVLTSFEDVLVRRATDLRALTAVSCPQGVRDHFDEGRSIEHRAFKVCELMERYVEVFGGGKMENLAFSRDKSGGSGRGPVDIYNALCDELADCRRRAKAAGFDLDIGHVQKFLAKDIMSWNNAWADDAFAGGKIPGWVEYLARVRTEKMKIDGTDSDTETWEKV